MMTVVLIILLLISLTIPLFTTLKQNARTAICKGQMRQMSILLTSYTTDHNGYLPNDSSKDIKGTDINNNRMYANWNGHLLPYLDSGIKSYHRMTALSIADANIYENNGMGNWFLKDKSIINPANNSDAGWNVINETYKNGGYNDLKLFICPEIHGNTFDVGVAQDFNNLQIPRISQMSATYLGFQGAPTNYLANNIFFGFDAPWRPIINSLRIDQIENTSQKAFIIEGGLAYAKGSNGEPEYIYYNLGDLSTTLISKSTGEHRLNYVHDSLGSFWIMPGLQNWNYFPYMWWDYNTRLNFANKFNAVFANKAEMIVGETYGCSIISYIDPSEKPFDAFFAANPPNATMNNFDLFDASEYHYLVGNMNVMFGDGSVTTKDQTWLNANKQKFGQITKD
jgi:hypothetical protein